MNGTTAIRALYSSSILTLLNISALTRTTSKGFPSVGNVLSTNHVPLCSYIFLAVVLPILLIQAIHPRLFVAVFFTTFAMPTSKQDSSFALFLGDSSYGFGTADKLK